MMSEQQFEVFQECEYLEEWSSCPYCIKYDGETVFETLPLGIAKEVCKKLNEQQAKIQQQEEIIKSQDMEISRQYNLCLAMSGVLREEFGVYDVFDRSKDKG